MKHEKIMDVRPYQLMCLVCHLGEAEKDDESAFPNERLKEIYRAIRKDRRQLLRLCCNVNPKLPYSYQNPGHDEDTPEGPDFNYKRDMDILQRLALLPGDVRPANELFNHIYKNIKTTGPICGYPDSSVPEWRGCPRARSGHYEAGVKKGWEYLFPPLRTPEMKAEAKARSAKATLDAEEIQLIPGHFMCVACFYGGKGEEGFAPFEGDNLYEVIARVRRNPEIPIRIVRDHCSVCPPCRDYDERVGLCPSERTAQLRIERKNLHILSRLDLKYGDVLPAKELFSRVFKRIPSTRDTCAYGDGVIRGWWTICGAPDGSPSYAKGRKAVLGIPGVENGD